MTYPTPLPGSTRRSTPLLPHIAVEVPRLRAVADAESELCFAVEGSPPGSGRSVPTGDGGVCLVHDLEGVVVCVTPTHLDLGNAVGLVRIRLVLPSAICLDDLLGHTVSLHTTHRLGARGGFDLRLRHQSGALLLWAYDGGVPGGDDALAVTWGETGLVLRSSAGCTTAPAQLGAVQIEGAERRCLTLRASAQSACFVVLR